jgi:acetyl/propionyl-CoA carboxylase alpha subunit
VRKILIANRGECALRLQKTLSAMGYQCVMLFSEEDHASKHCSVGNQAYSLGSGPSSETYLNQEIIFEIAKLSGCFGIHPGYGFLAENSSFAHECEKAGLLWIGPSPKLIQLFGDKIAARNAMKLRGVPILPGSMEPIKNIDSIQDLVAQFQGPALLKAAGGGGGKGMRIVRDPRLLEESFTQCSSESLKSFGDPRVFVERYVEKARHIEIQVLGDKHGNACHFGARECSVQRRHQKVLEESPVPDLDADILQELIVGVVDATRDLGYDSLGTYEFLLTPEGEFFFLETNTRLQVEHSVTELTYGIDLVELQMRSALGESIDPALFSMSPRGWAIEARIYAEDPLENFAPSPGKVEMIKMPDEEEMRIDSYLREGGEVPVFFDPMVAKTTVWARNRNAAVLKLKRVLGNFHLGGFPTNISFHLWLLEQDAFLDNEVDTGFLDRNQEKVHTDLLSFRQRHEAAAVGISYLLQKTHPVFEKHGLHASLNEKFLHFEISNPGGVDVVQINYKDQRPVELKLMRMGGAEFQALVDQVPVNGVYRREENEIQIGFQGEVFSVRLYAPGTIPLKFLKPVQRERDGEVVSPIQGTVIRILCTTEQEVEEGELLLVVEAMKMENEIRAPRSGTLEWIFEQEGVSVSGGDMLARISIPSAVPRE